MTRPASNATPWWRLRRAVLAAWACLFTIALLICAGAAWPMVLYRLLSDGLLCVIWLIAAGGWGCWIPLPDSDNRAFRFMTRLGLGLGIVTLVTLGISVLGLINSVSAWAIIAVGLALAAVKLIRRRDAAKSFLHQFSAPLTTAASWLWLAVAPLAAVIIVCCFVPPGVLWGDEPNGYDVLEYHLQLPREWYEAGRITTSPNNVFSYMPMGVETQYLLAMELRGGPWQGMYLAQLMHAALCALTPAAVWSIARQHGASQSVIAGVFSATVPWLALLAPVAYNEGGMLLFATLAIGWALHSIRSDEPAQAMIVCGAMIGFACGCKLTAVPALLIALPVAALAAAALLRALSARIAIACATSIVVALVVFAPWALRDMIATGNPVFPEAQETLGRAHFSPAQTERWIQANHLPNVKYRSTAGRMHELREQIFFDWRYGLVLIPLAVVAAVRGRRQLDSLLLFLLLLLLAVFWTGFTHLQSRFFMLAIPICALVVAQMPYVKFAASCLLLQFLVTMVGISQSFSDRPVKLRDAGGLGIDDLKPLLAPDIAEVLKTDQKLALVGDATAFKYPIPMNRLHYRTVFDVDVKPGQSIIDAWLAGASDANTIIIDPEELTRFSHTYYGIPAPPLQYSGQQPIILRR